MRLINLLIIFFLLSGLSFAGGSWGKQGFPHAQEEDSIIIKHEIAINLVPEKSFLDVNDRLTIINRDIDELTFYIHNGMDVSSKDVEIRFLRTDGIRDVYSVKLNNKRSFTLSYSGTIFHPLREPEKEYSRGIIKTEGIISREGIYLDYGSYWYPVVDNAMVIFSLNVSLPHGWSSISQGERIIRNGRSLWIEDKPREEIYLIGGRFIEYVDNINDIEIMVFLRNPDPELAGNYIRTAKRYLTLYEGLIGKYPYKKFAVVENFWETGFGMPSFTLLGPKVMRLPFIIETSYPHEILHNYFGNGVYVKGGNWSEGLTAYLSDHLMKEEKGEDSEYRFTILQKYMDYVDGGKDFSLREFISRHDPSSEAVGYGKGAMFFHMLRQWMGDELFIKSLREFYRRFLFRQAGFDDILHVFEDVSGLSLKKEFSQWIDEEGAPLLNISLRGLERINNRYHLRFRIEQTGVVNPYSLKIPVVITLKNKKEAIYRILNLDTISTEFEVTTDLRPLRLDIDPYYDIFRRLTRDEIPPAISGILGSKKVTLILPSSTEPHEVIDKIRSSVTGELGVVSDTMVERLPEDGGIIISGWNNRFLEKFLISIDKDIKISQGYVSINGKRFSMDESIFVLSSRMGGNPVLFLGATDLKRLEEVLKKIPHYHKYSYLVFDHNGKNILKGRWSMDGSPMTVFIPDEDGNIKRIQMGDVKKSRTLIDVNNDDPIMMTIMTLTSPLFEGRGTGTEGLNRAGDYIYRRFIEKGVKTYIQEFRVNKTESKEVINLRNIISSVGDGKCLIIGAHYDHLGYGFPDVKTPNRGYIHPGADDNASGVALLIELIDSFKNRSLKNEIIFTAMSGEEMGMLGSKYLVENLNKECLAMINIDTVGRLKDRLIVTGVNAAIGWHDIVKEASKKSGLKVEMVPETINAGDDLSFILRGIPAVQITTGPHENYHTPEDTPDKINIEGLMRIRVFIENLINGILERATLTFRAGKSDIRDGGERRKVSIGTIPDFTYTGEGYRVSGVVPQSPASIAGLKEGDIIIEMNSVPVKSMKDMAEIIKRLSAGEKVMIKVLRGKDIFSIEVLIKER